MGPKQNRFLELEGVRGIAAIMVAVYHYLLAFYALAFLGLHSGIAVKQNMRLEDNLYGNPIMVFLSGTFAVAIFFVLSGFVLSIGFFQTGKLDIIRKLAAKRYLRLMIPALASILVAWFLLTLGLSHTQAAASITGSGWLQSSWSFNPDLLNAIYSGIAGIFVQSGNGYNNALWTMTTEFFGSFIVFGFLAFFAKSPYRRVLYAVLIIVTFNTWFMAFIIGMILADFHASGYLRLKKRGVWTYAMVAAGLFLAGYPYGGAEGTVYQFITIPGVQLDWKILYLSIGATLLVVGVLMTERLTAFFSHRRISWLGKYTFSLYLVHLAILYTVTTFVFTVLIHRVHLGFNMAVILSLVSSIPVVAIATYLFEKYIDSKAIILASHAAQIIMGERSFTEFFDIKSMRESYERSYINTVQAISLRRLKLANEQLIEQ